MQIQEGLDLMLGKTFVSCTASDNTMIFKTAEGEIFEFYHSQDCCESVFIESIVGDLDDLVENPLLVAEEIISNSRDSGYGDSSTWTFYKFATVKGWVDVRWFGESNGYYSESVDLSYTSNLN